MKCSVPARKFRTLCLLLFFLSLAGVWAERWEVGIAKSDPSAAYLSTSGTGAHGKLEEAIASLPREAPGATLRHIAPGSYFHSDAGAREEIRAWLEKHHPDALAAALKSSGNLHNPKLTPLQKPYEEAILATSFVARANKALAKIGCKISRVESEKFFIDQRNGTPVAFVWLMVEPAGGESSARR